MYPGPGSYNPLNYKLPVPKTKFGT